MNIVLATYSYYPYNFGGTEVYISGLAKFLKNQGHTITIIAGMPELAFTDHPVLYDDDHLKTITYKFDDIDVIGVIMKNTTTLEIYSKFRFQAVASWIKILNLMPQQQWDILHFHAYTFAIGRNILNAMKRHYPSVKIYFSYHLPVSCVKNTLVFGNQMKDCTTKPGVNICSACYLNYKKSIPLTLGKSLLYFLPELKSEKPPFIFRLKYLVRESINAFKHLVHSVDRWQVFSEQIHDTLLLNGVSRKKLFVFNHGVDKLFLEGDGKLNQSKRSQNTTSFLYVGRFEKLKGFHTLLNSWNGLDEKEDRKLEIIGEMQSNDEEISLVIEKTKARNDIIWHGKKTQSEIAHILEKVHCAIIPSEWVEIGPLVYHEAISKGCDVIASDIGGNKLLAEKYKDKSKVFRTGKIKSLQKVIIDFKYSEVKLQVPIQTESYKLLEIHYQEMISKI